MMSSLHANREGTRGTLEVEIIQEVTGRRGREETAWNYARCGRCNWTITEILRYLLLSIFGCVST